MIKLTRGEGEVIRGALEEVLGLIYNGDEYELAYDMKNDLSCILESVEDAHKIIKSVLEYIEIDEEILYE